MIGISVIIPVRNTPADVLDECIQSFVKQSYPFFELLIVDDSSNREDTIGILKLYESKYSNIRIISLISRVGAAEARNFGLREAKGKYVIFADSDDTCNKDYLRLLFEKIEADHADVCVCGIRIFNNDKNKPLLRRIMIESDYDKRACSDYLCRVTTSPCNKLCKKEYLNMENIYFQSLPSDNDTYYSIMSVLCTEKVSYVTKELYEYRFNTDFQISRHRDPIYHLEAIKRVKRDICKKKIYKPYMDELINVYFVIIGVQEMISCEDIKKVRYFYDEGKMFIQNCMGVISFPKAAIYIEKWSSMSYESGWINIISDYYSQMELNIDSIKNILCDSSKDVYVWGMGKRGKAFLKLCDNYGIPIKGICDFDKSRCKELKDSDIKIMTTEAVLEKKELIVATNHVIFEFLCNIGYEDAHIFNLEDFCPL